MNIAGFTAENSLYRKGSFVSNRRSAGARPQTPPSASIYPALYAEYPCYTNPDGSDGWCWVACGDPWDGGFGGCTFGSDAD
jgi:hypothetical protein